MNDRRPLPTPDDLRATPAHKAWKHDGISDANSDAARTAPITIGNPKSGTVPNTPRMNTGVHQSGWPLLMVQGARRPRAASTLRRGLLKGDPDLWGVLREGIKTKVQEFLPGH